jgi:transcriptional regulator GlxA family with amidase domain
MKLLRDLRMNLASSLLEQSELPVERIAELVGFRSRSAFTRTFESVTGKSPHAFRSDLRKK